MQDGLRTENFLVGSVISNTLSGDIINVGTAIATAEIEDSAVTLVKIAAAAVDADTNTLSSGSRWVAFRSAFTGTPWVAANVRSTGRTAQGANTDFGWFAVGSIAPGSFLALGSVAGGNWTFDWVAVGSR